MASFQTLDQLREDLDDTLLTDSGILNRLTPQSRNSRVTSGGGAGWERGAAQGDTIRGVTP